MEDLKYETLDFYGNAFRISRSQALKLLDNDESQLTYAEARVRNGEHSSFVAYNVNSVRVSPVSE